MKEEVKEEDAARPEPPEEEHGGWRLWRILGQANVIYSESVRLYMDPGSGFLRALHCHPYGKPMAGVTVSM